MNPLDDARTALGSMVGDTHLADNLFASYSAIGTAYLSGNPVRALQNVGLFVESEMRVIEHVVTGAHTPTSKSFDLDSAIRQLERLSGYDNLRILAARMSRAVYDFRTRKKSVHLKAIDPLLIDANLVYNACTWIFIEILKESGLSEADAFIALAASRKTVLVQEAGGILRTTQPKLSGTQRLILLLYSAPTFLTEDQLHQATRTKIKTKDHLRKNLKSLENRDIIHNLGNQQWQIFGQGIQEAEKILARFSI